MLTHKIIIHKPKVDFPTYPSQGSNVVPYNHAVRHGAWQPKCRTQDELDEYLRRTVITDDAFVISKNWSADVKPQLFRIHYVLYVEKQLTRVPAFELGHPRCFYMVQLDSATTTPWMRWSTIQDYRVITPEEYKEIVEPQHDYVQNCIQEYRKQTQHLKTAEKLPSPF